MSKIGTLITFVAGSKAKASEVNSNFSDAKTSVNALYDDVGVLSSLTTSAKTSIVSAINEVNAKDVILADGSNDFDNLESYKKTSVTGATNASPIVITSTAHGRLTGDKVYISGVVGNTAANGEWTITKISADTFSLDSSTGNGSYTSGGTIYLYPKNNENLTNKLYIDNKITDASNFVSTFKEYGLIPSNNGSDINNYIDISAGVSFDDTYAHKMTFAGMTKRLNSSFTAGTNQGGLNTGTKQANTWYDLYLIGKTDGTTDVMFSTYANRNTLPSGFSYKYYLGYSILTDSSGYILPFYVSNESFIFKSRIVNRAFATIATTSAETVTVSSPLGRNFLTEISGLADPSTSNYINLQSTYETDITPTQDNSVSVFGDGTPVAYNLIILADTSSQIRSRSTSTANAISIITKGYKKYKAA